MSEVSLQRTALSHPVPFPSLPLNHQVEKVLQNYSEKMKGAASLLPEDVERLIDSKAVAISMDSLANRRSYIELCAHLKTGEKLTRKLRLFKIQRHIR